MAGLDFDVAMPALPPFVARLSGAPQIITQELVASMHRVVIAGQNASRQLAPVDTGRFRNSITGRVTGGAGSVVGAWGSNVQYARVMEDGRRPGAPMPPSGALLGWMARHGIPAAAEFVVRRAIGRHGIPARHVFSRALDAVRPIALRELSAGMARALARIGGGT